MYVATLALIIVIVQARTQGAWAGGLFLEEGGGVGANRAKLHVAVALLSIAACVHFDCCCIHAAGNAGIGRKVRQPWY